MSVEELLNKFKEYSAEIDIDKLNAKLSVEYESIKKSVQLTLCFQDQPPEEAKDTLYGALNEINLNLPVGHFGICPHGGSIILHTSFFITEAFDRAKFRKTVEVLLGEGITHYPLITGLVFAEPASA